jgi:hypothetical protein
MRPPDLKVLKDEITEDRVRAPGEADTDSSDQPISPRPIPLRKGRPLNVDEVLARSLRSVVGEV